MLVPVLVLPNPQNAVLIATRRPKAAERQAERLDAIARDLQDKVGPPKIRGLAWLRRLRSWHAGSVKPDEARQGLRQLGAVESDVRARIGRPRNSARPR